MRLTLVFLLLVNTVSDSSLFAARVRGIYIQDPVTNVYIFMMWLLEKLLKNSDGMDQ